ncbi:MAG: hypothetical protein K9N29_03130 [Candidatus Marinimicrobia bacterium]|nr:hypothetical protein [Candidatus Neomarinimicrobiota bacterium]
MIELLIVQTIDFSFNLLFPDPDEVMNVANAIGNQYGLNSNYPIDMREKGFYGRSANRNDPKADTIHRNGAFCYSKTRAARAARLFPGQGVFRFENKLNRQAVTRALGSNFQFIELFDAQEQIMKSCRNALKHIQITEGNVLVSKDRIMFMLFQLKPLRNQLHPWHLDNLLMGYELFYEPLEKEWDLLVSKKRVNWFRNRILNGKLGVLHAALEEGDNNSYRLYEMIMDEIENYFDGTSPFCCNT